MGHFCRTLIQNENLSIYRITKEAKKIKETTDMIANIKI